MQWHESQDQQNGEGEDMEKGISQVFFSREIIKQKTFEEYFDKENI